MPSVAPADQARARAALDELDRALRIARDDLAAAVELSGLLPEQVRDTSGRYVLLDAYGARAVAAALAALPTNPS